MPDDITTPIPLADGWTLEVTTSRGTVPYVYVDWINTGAQAPQPWVFTPSEARALGQRLMAASAALSLPEPDDLGDGVPLHGVRTIDLLKVMLSVGPGTPVIVMDHVTMRPMPYDVGVGVIAHHGELDGQECVIMAAHVLEQDGGPDAPGDGS